MRRLLLALVPLLVLAGLIALFAANIDRDPGFVPSVLINKPAPQIALPPLAGIGLPGLDPEAFTNDRNIVSVVNVFASWCVPCRDEHPLLVQLKKDATGIRLIGLNQKDAPENARAFLDELGNPYDAIGTDSDGRASIEWGVYGVPETFVVNSRGIITYKHTGPISARTMLDSVLPAIAEAQAR